MLASSSSNLHRNRGNSNTSTKTQWQREDTKKKNGLPPYESELDSFVTMAVVNLQFHPIPICQLSRRNLECFAECNYSPAVFFVSGFYTSKFQRVVSTDRAWAFSCSDFFLQSGTQPLSWLYGHQCRCHRLSFACSPQVDPHRFTVECSTYRKRARFTTKTSQRFFSPGPKSQQSLTWTIYGPGLLPSSSSPCAKLQASLVHWPFCQKAQSLVL